MVYDAYDWRYMHAQRGLPDWLSSRDWSVLVDKWIACQSRSSKTWNQNPICVILKTLETILVPALLVSRHWELRPRKHGWLTRCRYEMAGWSVMSGVFDMMYQCWQHAGDSKDATRRLSKWIHMWHLMTLMAGMLRKYIHPLTWAHLHEALLTLRARN